MARELIVRVGDLLRDPGSRRDVDCHVDLSPLGTSATALIPGMPVDVVGQAMSMAMEASAEVVGSVAFNWYGECRRCLDEIHGHIQVPFREVAQRTPLDDEMLPIEGDLLDLEPLVREIVLASLPIAPLCRDDCPGPAPDRFPTTTEFELEAEAAALAAAAEEILDPRWSVLDGLTFDD